MALQVIQQLSKTVFEILIKKLGSRFIPLWRGYLLTMMPSVIWEDLIRYNYGIVWNLAKLIRE